MRRSLFVVLLASLATPAVAKPPAPVFTGYDEANLDRSANPCDDFFQFACGGWLKRTEIPADQSSWGNFHELDERNEKLTREILEEAAAGKAPEDEAYRDKLGAFWSSCMDEEAVEKSAPAALAAEWKRLDAAKGPAIAREIARLQLQGGRPLFHVDQQADPGDAKRTIAQLTQGGIGLPDRDYYLSGDKKMTELRALYEQHVAKMLELGGEPAARAQADAKAVMKLETALAQASMSRVDRRDPKKTYHLQKRTVFEKSMPRFPWTAYFQALGRPDVAEANVESPAFFDAAGKVWAKTPAAEQHAYLRWHAIHDMASYLNKAIVDENFHFYGQALRGAKELRPRWKRCVQYTNEILGEAAARPFVARTFGAEGKQATQEMVKSIEDAMDRDLSSLKWMDDKTRAAAKVKLEKIYNMIGYPDHWRNYDALQIEKGDFVGNMVRGEEFETKRQLAKIGKPTDRTDWEMVPSEVNAYYEPLFNEMVFPAGILQPPFFDRKALPSVNYGAAGMVMGHELTHGFDDEGRQYDAGGNLRDWWSPDVEKEFNRRAQCVAEQFNGYTPVDDLHINGKLTLGENLADLGGMKLALSAMRKRNGGKSEKHGEFTDDQLFFLGYAQVWCGKRRPEEERRLITIDPHSPPRYRVDGPMSNLPDFAKAWQCKPGQKMVRASSCEVW